jgi:ribosomal protein S18 acetylase RimI-like enzyme
MPQTTQITNPEELEILRNKKSFNYALDTPTIDLLKKNLALKDSLYLITKKGTAFAAFCSIDRDWWEDNFFFIREILVDPNFQKLGLGEELMARCINHAKSKNAAGIVTETAFKNTPMQNLCTKLGFKEWDNPQWKEGVTYKLVF